MPPPPHPNMLLKIHQLTKKISSSRLVRKISSIFNESTPTTSETFVPSYPLFSLSRYQPLSLSKPLCCSHGGHIYISVQGSCLTYVINPQRQLPLGPKTYGWAYPAGELGLVRISIGVDGIIFMFDGIILQHVTSNLAIFTCLAHNYIIIWPQMQTNIKTKL